MPNKTLRLEMAKAIQNYRLVKMMPVYSKDEIVDVVNAWVAIIEPEHIPAEHIAELFQFAVVRHGDAPKFGADVLARYYGAFRENLKSAAYARYYADLDQAGDNDVLRRSADKRLNESLQLTRGAQAAAALDSAQPLGE